MISKSECNNKKSKGNKKSEGNKKTPPSGGAFLVSDVFGYLVADVWCYQAEREFAGEISFEDLNLVSVSTVPALSWCMPCDCE